ncbi:hypothetical protein KAX06_05980 [candidate division WOR-3 bacterium]|nr:hypothetical protein [candidate division WOR-3 bacterium]
MNCLSILLILFVSFNPEAQADALLSLVTTPTIELTDSRTAFDNTGHLWLIHLWGKEHYASRLAPNGKWALDKVPIPPIFQLGQDVVCDRWGNAYFDYFPKREKPPSIMRVTPEGKITDYAPWPTDTKYSLAKYIVPGDTLFVVGDDWYSWDNRTAKALLTRDEMIPLTEDIHSKNESKALDYLKLGSIYDEVILEWSKGWGIKTIIIKGETKDLHVRRINLKPDDYTAEETRVYPWRNYIWRSYTDAWIRWMTLTRHKDSGYILCIPDPDDSTTTHLLRLDKDGVPIAPAELKDGGARSARSFGRLPDEAEKHVYFKTWIKYNPLLAPDSALVQFWGCDDEGNLYAYRKVKRF